MKPLPSGFPRGRCEDAGALASDLRARRPRGARPDGWRGAAASTQNSSSAILLSQQNACDGAERR